MFMFCNLTSSRNGKAIYVNMDQVQTYYPAEYHGKKATGLCFGTLPDAEVVYVEESPEEIEQLMRTAIAMFFPKMT